MPQTAPVSMYRSAQSLAEWRFFGTSGNFEDLYELYFLKEYLLLTKKYGIAVSSVDFSKDLLEIKDTCGYIHSLKDQEKHIAPLIFFYSNEQFDELFYPEAFISPSVVYTNIDGLILPRLMAETETFSDMHSPAQGTPPVAVYVEKNTIVIALNGDFWLPRKEVDATIAGLNAPRFNSYLRGVKRLMRSVGFQSDFQDYSKGRVVEDGILLNGYVLYAEVIASVLNSDVESWMPLRRDYDFPLLDELSASEARRIAGEYAKKYDLNTIINDQTRTVYYDSFDEIEGAAWVVEADLPPSGFDMYCLSYVVSAGKGRVEYIINDSGFIKYPHEGYDEFTDEDIDELGFDVLE